MRIIGIKVYYMDQSIQKVLEPGWYPFGHYREPNEDGYLYVDKLNYVEKSIYRLRRNQPEVSVSCLVGMNGSGKSTILDIIYRIINNTTFACIITTTNLSNDTNYNASEYASNYTNLEIAGDFIRKIRYN